MIDLKDENIEMLIFLVYAIVLILIFYIIVKNANELMNISDEGFTSKSKNKTNKQTKTKKKKPVRMLSSEPKTCINKKINNDQMNNKKINNDQINKKLVSDSETGVFIDDLASTISDSENDEERNMLVKKLMEQKLNKDIPKYMLPNDKFKSKDNYKIKLDSKNSMPKNVSSDYKTKKIYHKNEEVCAPSKRNNKGKVEIGKNKICKIKKGEDKNVGCIACKVDFSVPENDVNHNGTNTNILETCKYNGKDGLSREDCLMKCSKKSDKFS